MQLKWHSRHSGATRAVSLGITLAWDQGATWIYRAQAQSAMEGALGAAARSSCVTGQDLGLSSPQSCGIIRHFFLGFAVFPGNCSVPALLLSKGKGDSCMWDGAVSIFCVGAVISASPPDRISALSSPWEGGSWESPLPEGLPMLCVSKCPKSSVGVAFPTAMEPWGGDSCLA